MNMKTKWAIFAVLGAFFVFVAHPGSGAINTRDIDSVRNKPVLESPDLQIIDAFMDEAVRELVNTKDFASIAQTRSIILARNTSRKSSAQAQYAEQFSESAYKYISLALKQAESTRDETPEDRRYKVILNLLILIDGLEDVRLADLAMALLKDENTVIRYWAVHSLTSPNFTKQLNSPANSQLARRVVEQLQGLVEISGPEILALIAEFSAEVSIPQGEDLLAQIADMRIKRYADWTVDCELLDAAILRLLYQKITSVAVPGKTPVSGGITPGIGVNKSAAARRFGQLFSYVLQRYVKGRDSLNDTQKHQLASVLVETEKSCISKLLASPQSVIKGAVERNDYTRLLLEHSKLLGDETEAGQLALKLNFDYGKNPNGTKRTAPLTLPEPPLKISGPEN